jgi:hypothetical protein
MSVTQSSRQKDFAAGALFGELLRLARFGKRESQGNWNGEGSDRDGPCELREPLGVRVREETADSEAALRGPDWLTDDRSDRATVSDLSKESGDGGSANGVRNAV